VITFAPVAAIAVIYREKASGNDVRNRPMLAKAIDVSAPATFSWLPSGTGRPGRWSTALKSSSEFTTGVR